MLKLGFPGERVRGGRELSEEGSQRWGDEKILRGR